MKELGNALTRIAGIVALPVLIIGYIIHGIFRATHVWAWNMNHSEAGKWVFTVPTKERK